MPTVKPLENYYQQESERLIFRSFESGDIERWLPFFDQDDYQRFLAQDISIPGIERATKWINRQIERKEIGVHGQLAIIEKETGKFIGVGGIIGRDDELKDGEQDYEITYSLLPEFWGKGYARELALHFINYAKENILVDSVMSWIHPENEASKNVARANGLKHDGDTTFMNMPIQVWRIHFD